MHCIFNEHAFPVVLREGCWRESTFNALAAVNLSPPCSPQLPTPQQKKKNTRKKGCIRVTGLCGRRKQASMCFSIAGLAVYTCATATLF